MISEHARRHKATLLAVLFALATSAASVATGESLREAVERAVRTNPEVLAANSHRLAADEGVKGARAGYLPRVELSAGTGRETLNDLNSRPLGLEHTTIERNEASLTLTQMLFDGFAVRSEVDRQLARVDSSAYGAAATAEDVAARTTDAYLDVLRRQETVAAAVESLGAHRAIHDRIRLRTESGVGRRADLDQADARVALAQVNLRGEESGLRDAEITYLRLVGAPPRQQVKPVAQPERLPQSEDEALQAALISNPSLRSADADVALAAAQNAVARAALLPRIDLEVGANHSRDIINTRADDVTVMLRLRYNLFRGGADQARVAESRFQIDEARETRNRVRRQVEERVSQTYNAYVTARDRLEALQRYAESSAATREAYAKQFNIGQRTLLDLLNAENEYFTARTGYVTGRYLLLAAHFRLLAAMGTLLETLGIALPPEALASSDSPPPRSLR